MRSWPRTADLLVCQLWVPERRGRYIPALLLIGLRKFDLDSVDAIDAIDEEDQNEDKGYLHPIL